MEQASFFLLDYKFTEVEIKYQDIEDGNLDLSIIPSGRFYKDENKFELTFVFKATGRLKGRKVRFVSVKCVSSFIFKERISLNLIPDYFYPNSIAILFPYIRAFISTVTLQANFEPILLPTMNLSSMKDELKNNTTEL